MIAALSAFLLFAWLAYREYQALPAVTPPFVWRLRRWRARGWIMASVGVLTCYLSVVIALGGEARGWWHVTDWLGLNLISIGLLGAVPLHVGLVVSFAAQVGLVTYRRYPGPIPDADRNVFRRGSDRAGA